MAVSYDSTSGWPGVVKAAFLKEVEPSFAWAWFSEENRNKPGGRKDGGRKPGQGVRQGGGGPPVMLPKWRLGLERTDPASLLHASY